MTIVCAVSARRSSHSASYGAGDEELLDVVIMIKKLSDTDNLFQYSSDIKGEKLLGILDLDDLEIVENGNRFRANFGKHGEDNQQIFAIQNFIEYNLFKDSILECRMLCEMTLRLNSFARDLYFAGIYSSQVAGEDGVYLSEVLQTIRDQQSFPMEFSIFDTSSSKIIEENEDAIDPKIQDSLSASSRTRQHVISDINCVFCGVQKMMEISKDFAVHPYVPATFQNKTIYMCVLCLQNWKEFREKAIKDNQLILKNEVNEELCGICSDTPAELIMCSECPRSFCNVCLLRILNESEVRELDSLTDWVCMCCHLHISSEPPPLGRSEWSIVKPSIGKRPNSNNIFFSRGTTGRLKSLTQSVDNSQISSRTEQNNIELKHNIQSYPTSLKSSPNTDLSKPTFAASGKSTKEISKEIYKERESKGASAAITKESKTVPVAVASPPIDLPYLDDFDDSSSPEEDNNEENKAAMETDNDDDCNLILTLANPRNTVSKKSKNNAEIQSPRKLDSRTQKKRRASRTKVPETSSPAPAPTPAVQPSSCTKKKRNSRQKNAVFDDISASDGTLLPPVNTAVDEVYYFSQYVQYYDNMCEGADKVKEKKVSATDDVCFLCKDGGDLIECDDCKSRNCDSRKRCKKVYHSYCLAYVVEDDGRDWRCPRHFCDYCGTVNLKYVCKFCPMSICKGCPAAMVRKYGLARYKVVATPKTGEFACKVITIVCQNCLDMYSRCLERGSEEYTFSEYTRNIMDGSPELLFLDEGSSGRSTKRDRSSSSVTNSSMATSEPGLSGSVSQSDLDTPHIATHERSGSESTAKTDDDNMKGYNNNNNNNGSSSSSSSGRHLGSDTGSSWDSERVGDADGMVPNAMPSGPSTDMSTRIRRRKSEIPEHTAVRSTSSASNGAGSVTQCVNGIEGVRARRGRPKRIIEEDQSSALPTPPITDYLNDYSTSAHIGNHHENKGRNRVEDGTHYPSFSSRTAPADATATSGMYYENNITAELSCPLDSESLMDSAKDYTINLPSSLPTTSGVTLLKILKKRKMRNLNLLTESSVPLSDLTPIDAAFRQPHGEQGTDPL